MDVSIVIPLYNRKEYIRKTLDSIAVSGVAPRQVIVVDNDSDDGSYAYVKNISGLYDYDIVLTTEKRRGASVARNKGLELCQSKWVYFFDSDDVFTGMPSSWDEGCDLVCLPTRQLVGGKLKTRSYECVSTPHTQIVSSMLNTPSMIFNTSFLRSIGGWDESLRIWDDWELGTRALIASRRTQWVASKAYHEILIHDDSITGRDFSSRCSAILSTLEKAGEDVTGVKDGMERNRCALALYLRCRMMCGMFKREGAMDAFRECVSFIDSHYSVNVNYKKIGDMLEWYVSKGGRGAWRIVMYIVRHM